MNTKHTKGNWKAVAQMPEGYSIETEQGQVIAFTQCDEEFNDTNPITQDQEVANAELIAHSPELLQMVYDLKNCIKRLTEDGMSQEDRDNEAQWIGEAHELLYKINSDYYKNANQ